MALTGQQSSLVDEGDTQGRLTHTHAYIHIFTCMNTHSAHTIMNTHM